MYRQLIIEIKNGNKELTAFMAQLLAKIIPADLLEAEAIAWVPASPASLAKRGFNPAEIFAREIHKIKKIALAPEAIKLIKVTKKQALLTREARQLNVAKAYTTGKITAGTKFILIDDVLTTGATSITCAQKIIDSGGKIVGTAFFSYRPPFL
jgi:predicted amidophosphoribosyltransferase